MKFVPREYQARARQFLDGHPDAMLWMDMGLGKTAVCLHAIADYLLDLEISKVLIVAPLRVCQLTWPLEIMEWDDLSWLDLTVLHGRKKLLRLQEDHHLYLINYEGLTWLDNALKTLKKQKKIKDFPFDAVIYDELSKMKSHKSERFKKFKKYTKHFDRRIGLTGTPASNGLLNLYSQFYLIDNGERLGTAFTRFRSAHFYPTDWQQRKWAPFPGSAEKIQEKVSDIVFVEKTEGNVELPACTVEDIEVAFSSAELECYQEFEARMFIELMTAEVEAVTTAVLLNKLRQFTAGFLYTDKEGSYEQVSLAKMDAFLELRAKIKGPCLIVYGFQQDLRALQERVDGQQFSGTRAQQVKTLQDWNAGKIDNLFCHPASVGHGLNLQKGGCTVIWYTLDWSLENYMQLNKRLHRSGQTQDVRIYRLIVQDSIDGLVATCLERKQYTQDTLVSAVQNYGKLNGYC